MKHLRKIALATIIISTSIASSGVFADDTTTTTTDTTSNTVSDSGVTNPPANPQQAPRPPKQGKMNDVKAARQDLKTAKEDRKAARQTLIEDNQKLRDEAKQNREDFKAQNDWLKEIFSKLDKDVQAQLKTVSEEHKAAIDTLKAELTGSWITEERKAEIDAQIKSLNETNIAKIKELAWTWSSAEIDAYFAKKAELVAENEALRNQAKQARTDFRQWQDAIITKYKDAYFAQLKLVIPKLSDAKLEDVNSRIDAMINKLDANTTMTEEKKTKMLAQLTSIKEIIQEEQDNRTKIDSTFDINTILE